MSRLRSLSCLALTLLTQRLLVAQDGKPAVNYDTFQVSKLTCVIGNNAPTGAHQSGYNGIFRLAAPGENESVFAPAFSGLNLEHFFDQQVIKGNPQVIFEPRYAPMHFQRVNATHAEIWQDSTPRFEVESRTAFELKEPYYVDVTFRATPKKSDYLGGFLGIFWASYINGPLDKSIYFLRGDSSLAAPQWVQFATQLHGRDSTVLPASDHTELVMGTDPKGVMRNLSPLRYSEPFFYGRFRDMVLIYIFRPSPYLRFAHSPTGGSRSAAGDDTNPAWDFQLVIPAPEAHKEYGFTMRIVYKPWAGRADVLREVAAWLQTTPPASR